jgi:hypothetical protein
VAGVSDVVAFVLAPKGVGFWIVTALTGMVAAALFVLNDAWNRSPIDAALSRASASAGTKLEIPERRRRGYTAKDLEDFMTAASKAEIGPGRSALVHYIAPTLLWMDVAFAVAWAVFSAMLILGVAPHLPYQPASTYSAVFRAIMALLYGVADVIEDWKLANLFDRGVPVDPDDAESASFFTKSKLVTITASIVAVIAFYLVRAISAVLKPLLR